jgi:hypothetical protein
VIGHYPDVEPRRFVLACKLPRIAVPVTCAGGGCADAIYQYVQRHTDRQHHIYRLVSIQEWLPPVHPTARGRRETVRNAKGDVDLEAEATLRRREWAQMGADVADDPFEDEGDDDADDSSDE